ncbi:MULTISPECIES: DUF4222 domain-containing protein [Edwardsiella]|uniref:DUF4222 domain-containing protein n=1 Tax=Edwardsiella TaxID=635 RepID=UPI0009F4407D|nr:MULTISPECIES: DUF4222 domain-containing protein [Edwardsiella]UCQ29188.1 DUF4222 domain-containing protein [Edwardsiella tarda]
MRIPKQGSYYQDRNGVVVRITGYERESQRVLYRRPGYEWGCASPLVVFNAKFRRYQG